MRDLPIDSPLRQIAASAQIEGVLDLVVPANERIAEHNYYGWYYAYGHLLAPRTILEIGVLGGGSVVALAMGAREARRPIDCAWLIDDGSHDGRLDVPPLATVAERLRTVSSPSCAIRTFNEDSQRMRELPAPTPLFDVISIDGDHRVGPCYHDLRIALPHLACDGHLLVDDAQWNWVQWAVDDFVDANETRRRGALDDLFVATATGTRILHDGGSDHLERCPLLRLNTT